MRRILSTAMVFACAAGFALAVEGMDWAYPVTPKGKGPPDKEKMLTVPGSKKQYTAGADRRQLQSAGLVPGRASDDAGGGLHRPATGRPGLRALPSADRRRSS